MSYWSRNFLFRFRVSSLKKESFQIFWNFFFKSSRESTKSSANIYCLEFFPLEFSSDFDCVLCFQSSRKCISRSFHAPTGLKTSNACQSSGESPFSSNAHWINVVGQQVRRNARNSSAIRNSINSRRMEEKKISLGKKIDFLQQQQRAKKFLNCINDNCNS